MSNAVGNSNWAFTGQTVQSGGGGFYSILDMKRAAVNPARTPDASYPDGYLGNSNSRYQDKLQNEMQSRLTQRSYQRGIHKGDRIDPSDYYWKPEENIDPEAGIRMQAQGLKWTQMGVQPRELVNYGKTDLLTPEQIANVANGLGINPTANIIDPVRSAKMQRYLPTWR